MINKMIFRCKKSAIMTAFALFTVYSVASSQNGLISDDFSTGSQYGWINNSGAFARIENGKLVVAMTKQANGKYRGDIKRNRQTVLHAGNYPIVAVKMHKPVKCSLIFDTQIGSYTDSVMNFKKIQTSTGNVYYWDLTEGMLGTTVLSKTNATTVSFIQFKVADVELTQSQIDSSDTLYDVDWVCTFQSEDSLHHFVDPNWISIPPFTHVGAFKHPGLLHDSTDIARLKRFANSPGTLPYSGYQNFISNKKSSSDYVMQGPFSQITRDATLPTDSASSNVNAKIESDVLAAYYTAVRWAVTGDKVYARKAIEIVDGYATKTTGITGSGPELNGLYGFLLANAAELLAYTPSGWTPGEISACKNMLKNVFYPVLENFKPCAHGNWDIICMKCLMAIAIFCDDNAMYNNVVNYFYFGEGNGSIYHYVVNESGQLQESNRDQGHTQLAIGCLSEIAEMAWKQGDDLYSANINAIMRGYEYAAKYNLGNDVPYAVSYDICEVNWPDYTPDSISSKSRGSFRAIYEIAYNHYTVRKKIAMPWTAQVLASLRPEGAPFGSDNPGYGTFLFYLDQGSNVKNGYRNFKNPCVKISKGVVTLSDLAADAHVSMFNLQGRLLYSYANSGKKCIHLPQISDVSCIVIEKSGQRSVFRVAGVE